MPNWANSFLSARMARNERNICRYPSHPCTKAPRGVKLGAPAVDPPECIDKDLFGDAHISDNPRRPLINFAVVLPVQRFEGVQVALHEPRKKLATWFVRHWPLLCLTRRSSKGSVRKLAPLATNDYLLEQKRAE